MNYEQWKFFYKKITKDLNIEEKKDIKSGYILDSILEKIDVLNEKKLEKKIKNQEIYIFGAGPSLEEKLDKYTNEFYKSVLITADGATSALTKKNINPDIIVTDLDGRISDQINANKKGSIVAIHAHADNIQKLLKYVHLFQDDIFGTTQVDPGFFKNLYNFGGFTDGDRAVFLCDHFKAKKINLVGFDFNNKIGKYSFAEKKDKELKLKKLNWCKFLIENLDNDSIFFL